MVMVMSRKEVEKGNGKEECCLPNQLMFRHGLQSVKLRFCCRARVISKEITLRSEKH